MMETLVLNRGYEPVARVSWQRAMTLLFRGKVEVVEEYEDRDIRSVTLVFKMPSVVRLIRALGRARRNVKFSRENVYARDAGRCQYCDRRVPRHEVTYDHVVPRSRGGMTTWENIVIACLPCNQRKGGRTPEQAGMALRCAPLRPKKLVESFRFTLTIDKHAPVPESWKGWLRDYAYWNAELDE